MRVTPQRVAILEAFDDRPDSHLAADEVHARATAVAPALGRGTVYATLAELVEQGLVAAVGTADPVRYEVNVEPHDHFRCRLCLRLFDTHFDEVDTRALQGDGFTVEHTAIVVEGICAECGDYRTGLLAGVARVTDEQLLPEDVLAKLACRRVDSVLGPLLLCASPDGIVRVVLEGHRDFAAAAARARAGKGPAASRRRLDEAVDAFDDFLGDGRNASTMPVDWAIADGAGQLALEATRQIPYGERRSYLQLGVEATPYDCGLALGSNPMPILLPCHRVTRGTVLIDAYVGGIALRDELDAFERRVLRAARA